MNKEMGICVCINLIIITMLAFGKFSEVTWFAFILFPLVFTLAYYLDDIINWIKK